MWKKLTKQIEPPIFVSLVVAETHDSFVNIENNDPGSIRNTRRGSRKPQFLPEPQFARVFAQPGSRDECVSTYQTSMFQALS